MLLHNFYFSISFSLNRPIHIAQDSLFSATSGWTDYRGLFNLAILLLFVSNGRVALENLIKYYFYSSIIV